MRLPRNSQVPRRILAVAAAVTAVGLLLCSDGTNPSSTDDGTDPSDITHHSGDSAYLVLPDTVDFGDTLAAVRLTVASSPATQFTWEAFVLARGLPR